MSMMEFIRNRTEQERKTQEAARNVNRLRVYRMKKINLKAGKTSWLKMIFPEVKS